MTEILDEGAVSEIEARAAKATEGPWVNPYHRCEVYQTLPDDEPHVESGWGLHYTRVQDICRTKKFEDGDFIAHAREDIPALCATVKHLRNKTCPDCATVAPDGSGYCHTCDSFTMPSDFSLRWVRRTQLNDLQSQLELRMKNFEVRSGPPKG